MLLYIVEPFYTGSHKQWVDGLAQHTNYDARTFTLSGYHWKWRMHGAALTLSTEILKEVAIPDIILVSDMLDLATFKALLGVRYHNTQFLLYFHENQLTYPWSPQDRDLHHQRDRHYGWINYTSALVADQIFFNSTYHRSSFLEAIPNFLKEFPDHMNLETVGVITSKSAVWPLNLHLKKFNNYEIKNESNVPLILWNHRWEYDKNPEVFFDTLIDLSNEGVVFQIAVLGEAFDSYPDIFDQANSQLKDKIIHFGYCDSFEEYAQWLWKSDILPVTSNQDFFGGSVVEAIYCNSIPLLPNRLAYPEHVTPDLLYADDVDFKLRLKGLLLGDYQATSFDGRALVEHYDWSCYDDGILEYRGV